MGFSILLYGERIFRRVSLGAKLAPFSDSRYAMLALFGAPRKKFGASRSQNRGGTRHRYPEYASRDSPQTVSGKS
jgi:hypothetical protein